MNETPPSQGTDIESLDLTHSITNFLFSAYRGKLIYVQILSKLQSTQTSSGELINAQDSLKKISEWIKELVQGKPILNKDWTEPETPEAKAAFRMLEHLKYELQDLAEKLDDVMEAGDYSSNRERVSLLAASLSRNAYTRYFYLEGFVHYAKHIADKELEQMYTEYLPSARYDVQIADISTDIVINRTRTDAEFYAEFKEECIELPSIFRSNIHDINLMMSLYEKEIKYRMVDIGEIEGQKWQEVNIGPAEAGYWRAYGILPHSVMSWKAVGIVNPIIAGAALKFGLNPQEAIQWIDADIHPRSAWHWINAGFDLKGAVEQIKKGVSSPPPPKKEDDKPRML